MRSLIPVLAGMLLLMTLSPTSAQTTGITRTPGGALTKTLPNGMQLIVLENHAAPIAVVNTWFRVGARNENPADEGISHFLEHMLFDGSDEMGLEEINAFLFKQGIDNNASTDNDNTNYYHVGPAAKFREIVQMTAMLVQRPLLLDSEFGREREVVKEEWRQGLDNPGTFLWDMVLPKSMAHTGYDHSVIGDADTLDAQTNDQMRDYYRKYYGPNNAFTIAIGDFDGTEAMGILEEYYAGWQVKEIAPDPVITASTQTAPMSLVGQRDFATNYIAMSWPTIAASAPESYALSVLARVLGQGNASRLKKAVQHDAGLVSDVSAYNVLLIDQSAMWVDAELVDPAKTTEAVELILREIARLKSEGPTAEEVARAKRSLILEHLFYGEDVQEHAYSMGYHLTATGNMDYFETLPAHLSGVTPADVQYVAQAFLKQANLTLGLATGNAAQPALAPNWSALDAASSLARPADIGRAATPLLGGNTTVAEAPASRLANLETLTLPRGIEVLINPLPGTGTVGISLATREGLGLETWDTNGLAALWERTLLRGTTTHDADALSGIIDTLGGRLSVAVGYDTATIRGLYAKEDAAAGIALIAELVDGPAFPQSEVDTAKELLQAEIAARADESYNTTHDQLAYAMWGPDVAYGRPPLGRASVAATLTRDDLIQFHSKVCASHNLVIAVVGDVDPAAIRAALEEAFPVRTEAPGIGIRSEGGVPFKKPESFQRIINNSDKAQTMSVLGIPGIDMNHPDLPALNAVNMILGETWLSRLFDRLRGKEGLAYGTYSRIEAYRYGGAITARIGTRPEMWEQAIAGMKREFGLIATEGITEDELATALSYTRGQAAMSHAGMLAQAGFLSRNVALDLPPDYEWLLVDRMADVTVEQANEVAAKYFGTDNAWLAVTGPIFQASSDLS